MKTVDVIQKRVRRSVAGICAVLLTAGCSNHTGSLSVTRINLRPLASPGNPKYLYSLSYPNLQSPVSVSVDGQQEVTLDATHTSAVVMSGAKVNEVSVNTGYLPINVPITSVIRKTFNYTGDGAFLSDYATALAYLQQQLAAAYGQYSLTFLDGADISLFQKSAVFNLTENTAADMYQSINATFLANQAALTAAWPGFSTDQLRMLFIFGVVSNLWHFGDIINPVNGGCAQVNETYTASNSDFIYGYDISGNLLYWRTARGMNDYLTKVGDIGCCTDFGFMLKAMLDQAGITAQRDMTLDHWLVEAVVDGQTYVLDPSFGLVIEQSMSGMTSGANRHAYLIPNRNLSFTYIYLGGTLGIGLPNAPDPVTLDEITIFTGYVDWAAYWDDGDPFNNESLQLIGQ